MPMVSTEGVESASNVRRNVGVGVLELSILVAVSLMPTFSRLASSILYNIMSSVNVSFCIAPFMSNVVRDEGTWLDSFLLRSIAALENILVCCCRLILASDNLYHRE